MSSASKSPVEFINKSSHDFASISHEAYREYFFPHAGKFVKRRIDNPTKVAVSESGGHRMFDAQGVSHYMASNWIELTIKPHDGVARFGSATVTDISSEDFREYYYPDDGKFVRRRIDNPRQLCVLDGGFHQVFDAQGVMHTMRSGWVELSWKAKDGHPHFVA